jgi:hypothetical protein
MAERLLISGKANSGKTTLLKDLPADATFVVSIDEKPFPLEIPHKNVYGFTDMEGFVYGEDHEDENGNATHITGIVESLEQFKERFGSMPKYFAIDSVSRVFQTAYDNLNDKYPTDNFKLYAELDREIRRFREFLTMMQKEGINVIIISHALYDEKEGTYKMVDSGKFSKSGGFLGIVDHAVFVEVKGKKRTIYHKNASLASRSLLEDLPEKQDVSEYNLKEHVDAIIASKADIAKFTFK